jgi:hypothetical protein
MQRRLYGLAALKGNDRNDRELDGLSIPAGLRGQAAFEAMLADLASYLASDMAAMITSRRNVTLVSHCALPQGRSSLSLRTFSVRSTAGQVFSTLQATSSPLRRLASLPQPRCGPPR